jgi:hypothetical protein
MIGFMTGGYFLHDQFNRAVAGSISVVPAALLK